MSERPTPETDAVWSDKTQNVLDFARRLERERDENYRQLLDLRAMFWRICREGFDNDDTIGGETFADYILRKIADLREELAKAKGGK